MPANDIKPGIRRTAIDGQRLLVVATLRAEAMKHDVQNSSVGGHRVPERFKFALVLRIERASKARAVAARRLRSSSTHAAGMVAPGPDRGTHAAVPAQSTAAPFGGDITRGARESPLVNAMLEQKHPQR